MKVTHRKEVLTTGEVAKICHVAPRTVSKWFDSGKLRGYRIPGSRDRRIPLDQLVAFMRAHGIPLDGLDGGTCRILIMNGGGSSQQQNLVQSLNEIERYEVRSVENGFEAGVSAQEFRPHVIVLEAEADEDETAIICRNIKSHSELQSAKVLAAVSQLDDSTRRRLLAMGFDECLLTPYSPEQLVRAVEDVTNIIG